MTKNTPTDSLKRQNSKGLSEIYCRRSIKTAAQSSAEQQNNSACIRQLTAKSANILAPLFGSRQTLRMPQDPDGPRKRKKNFLQKKADARQSPTKYISIN
jgi:hypothetical protein